jgi:hypothetical protein
MLRQTRITDRPLSLTEKMAKCDIVFVYHYGTGCAANRSGPFGAGAMTAANEIPKVAERIRPSGRGLGGLGAVCPRRGAPPALGPSGRRLIAAVVRVPNTRKHSPALNRRGVGDVVGPIANQCQTRQTIVPKSQVFFLLACVGGWGILHLRPRRACG